MYGFGALCLLHHSCLALAEFALQHDVSRLFACAIAHVVGAASIVEQEYGPLSIMRV